MFPSSICAIEKNALKRIITIFVFYCACIIESFGSTFIIAWNFFENIPLKFKSNIRFKLPLNVYLALRDSIVSSCLR